MSDERGEGVATFGLNGSERKLAAFDFLVLAEGVAPFWVHGATEPRPPREAWVWASERMAVIRATDPAATTGGVPVVIRGSDVPHRRCWCLFGRLGSSAYAARVLRVSSAVSRCAEAPPGLLGVGGARRVVVRIACAWGAAGLSAAALEPADESPTLSVPASESGFNTAAAFAMSESGVALSLVSRPAIVSTKPRRVSGAGGVAMTLTASSLQHAGGDDADGDGDGSRYGCHFGSVGPIAARSIGEDRVGCVAPALGVGKVTVGLSLDANARETEWSHLVVVRVDSYYLEGFLARGAEGAGMPSGGAASGGATYESVAGVAGIHWKSDRTSSSVVRCAFGDAFVAGAWIHRGGNGNDEHSHWDDTRVHGGGVTSVSCVTPPRLTSAGFVPVRIFVDGSDANALGDSAIFQYAVSPDARTRTVFPRLSWGAEVVSVAGTHLAGPGDSIGGAPRDASASGSENGGETRCVFAGVAFPARVVSSAVMTCETLAEVGSFGGGSAHRRWWGPNDAFDEHEPMTGANEGGSLGAALRGVEGVPGGVVGAQGQRVNEGGDATRGVRAVSACAVGSACGSDGSDGFGGGASSLWFQSVRASSPVIADIDEGWDDGGTLVRLALSTRTPADWLDCAFGTTRVPARPAAASDDPHLPETAETAMGGMRGGVNMDLECVSPAHAPGVVDVEIALTRSRMPSSGGAVKFAYA